MSTPSFLLDPKYHDILSIIKGIRNGMVYGAKIRFPHALVMTFLFRNHLPFRKKMELIMDATYQHSRNLATFVGIYKTLMVLMRRMRLDGKERSIDSFLSGLVGGWIVFGKDTGVNQQINLYLFSRIIVGLAKMATAQGHLSAIGLPPSVLKSVPDTVLGTKRADIPASELAINEARGEMIFPIFGSVVWAVVMWLFRHERYSLQPSLQSSMQYLYNDSEKWTELRNWIWHNI